MTAATTDRISVTQPAPGVVRLALANPPRNTLDLPLMRQMTKLVKQLTSAQGDARPKVIVLASDVPHQFSVGVDPKAVLDADAAGRTAIFLGLADLVEALWFAYVPIVADVSGPALAGGAVLAAVGDFAVIDTHAGKISFSEVKVGLPLPLFVQRLVERKILPSAWSDVMLLGRNLDAAEACRVGFANAAYAGDVDRDEVLGTILDRITRLPAAVISETLRQGRSRDLGVVPAFRQDLARFAAFLGDDFLGKGLAAVLKGESPRF